MPPRATTLYVTLRKRPAGRNRYIASGICSRADFAPTIDAAQKRRPRLACERRRCNWHTFCAATPSALSFEVRSAMHCCVHVLCSPPCADRMLILTTCVTSRIVAQYRPRVVAFPRARRGVSGFLEHCSIIKPSDRDFYTVILYNQTGVRCARARVRIRQSFPNENVARYGGVRRKLNMTPFNDVVAKY